jgi:hypothetical protein
MVRSRDCLCGSGAGSNPGSGGSAARGLAMSACASGNRATNTGSHPKLLLPVVGHPNQAKSRCAVG